MNPQIDGFFAPQYRVKLNIPKDWKIVKDHLLTLDVDAINQLDVETKFSLTQLCYYADIFRAQYPHQHQNKLYMVYLDIYCYETVKNGEYLKFEYDLSCHIYRQTKKFSPAIVEIESKLLTLDQVTAKLHQLMATIPLIIDDLLNNKDASLIKRAIDE